jgi:hypothetical protein
MIGPLLLLIGIIGAGLYLISRQSETPPAPSIPQSSNSADNITQQPDVSDTQLLVSPGFMITFDPNTWPSGNKIWDICRAIAEAEGYDTDGAAFHLNNPGDLSPGDEHGFPTIGPAEFHDGSYIIHFATALDGWNALFQKVSNIVEGKSKVYGQYWTITQIASKYAGDSANWAKNVGAILGIDPNSQGFYDYVNS